LVFKNTEQETTPSEKAGEKKQPSKPSAGIADYMAGESRAFVSNLKPHLPQELIGGMIPHVPGTEEEAVWNAASQACSTEKVNFVYSVDAGRVWYLACPSSALASSPDSWCPLAAALPGHSEYWDQETVYLYEQEGLASALRWDPETHRMQVFLGASRTILPRIQSMDANFVTINADIADIVPWRNKGLKTEKLARATVRTLFLSGLFIFFVAASFLIFNFFSINYMERDLVSVKKETDKAAEEIMFSALKLVQSDTGKHLAGIQKLLDDLAKVGGTLTKYEVKKGKIVWEALVPPAFADQFKNRAQILPGFEKDGRARIRGTRI